MLFSLPEVTFLLLHVTFFSVFLHVGCSLESPVDSQNTTVWISEILSQGVWVRSKHL